MRATLRDMNPISQAPLDPSPGRKMLNKVPLTTSTPIFAVVLAVVFGAEQYTIGDEMSQNSHKYGGLGLGTTGTSYIFLGSILALVTYLSITKKDETPPDVILEEEGAAAGGHAHGRTRLELSPDEA